MRFELKLLKRYAFSRRRGLAGFTALAAVLGIAFGVGGLIIAQALGNGFQIEVRDKLLNNFPHIAIFRTEGAITDAAEIADRIKQLENVSAIKQNATASAILSGTGSVNYAILQTAEDNPTGVSIGIEIAAAAQLREGDIAEIVTLVSGADPLKTKIKIASTFATGIYEYDLLRINVSPLEFAALTGANEFRPTMLAVNVDDIYASDKTADEIRKMLGSDFRVIDWQEANRPFFAALSLERRAALFILSLIIVIAGVNVATTLTLLVNERRRDIAVLRTAGARSRSLLFVFLVEGSMLGLAGVMLGSLFGLGGCYLANRFKLISLDREVYLLDSITLMPYFSDVFIVCIFVLILSLFFSAFPALRAIGLKPLENIRDQ